MHVKQALKYNVAFFSFSFSHSFFGGGGVGADGAGRCQSTVVTAGYIFKLIFQNYFYLPFLEFSLVAAGGFLI